MAAAFLPAGFHFSHRLMGGTTGPETVTVSAETRLEKRSQHLRNGLLDQAIQHRLIRVRPIEALRGFLKGIDTKIEREEDRL